MDTLPEPFLERLQHIIPQQYQQSVLPCFSLPSPYVLRINRCKAESAKVVSDFERAGLPFRGVSGFPAVILNGSSSEIPLVQKMLDEGVVYKQSLSSMVPALVLDPHPGDYVLDLCAAPGSKTSQIADMMHNQGTLIAVEHVRSRYYRLRSVLNLLNVTMAEAKCLDGRRYRSTYLFDKILVDAPCSSEGRFKTFYPDSYAYWSTRKINEMVQKQRGLLLNASRLLKSGGELVYATCTLAPEENEGVIDWLLKKTEGALKLVPIRLDGIMTYPALLGWEKRSYNDQVKYACRILPTETMEGFFIAKLVKG